MNKVIQVVHLRKEEHLFSSCNSGDGAVSYNLNDLSKDD